MSSEPKALARVLVVDASGVARLVATRALGAHVQVVACPSGEAALDELTPETTLVVTALRLPGMDGDALAQAIRQQPGHELTPILAVSGNVAEALAERSLSPALTDYFDKGMGSKAMAAFFQAYLQPHLPVEGQILLVEDSRSIRVMMRNMLTKRGATVIEVESAEDAIAILDRDLARGVASTVDLVLTDLQLSSDLSGMDIITHLRQTRFVMSETLPVIVTSGEENPAEQASLIRAGADDVLVKPVREARLLPKIHFHLWRSHQARLTPG